MAFKTPVSTIEKIFLTAIIIGSLGLCFVAGQIVYYTLLPNNGSQDITNIFDKETSTNLLNSVQSDLILTLDYQKFTVPSKIVRSWLEKYYRFYTNTVEYRLNQKLISTYLEGIAKKIDTPAINARFTFDGEKISESRPAKLGLKLNKEKSYTNILATLTDDSYKTGLLEESVLAMDESEPVISLEKANKLGINSLLGVGKSNFYGSSKSRIININAGAEKFNGLILAPGEEFSFNKILGDVSTEQGFVNELVIKNKQIIPELGGGICQVSTTMFRAAMVAGLPIIERHNHSLPVHYYNPQGYDATIYPGSSNLRFINDTPGYILIESKTNGLEISFEIYGKNDERNVKIIGPVQYDIKPDGSMKALVTQEVIYADGKERKDKYYSNYQSPSLFPTVRNPLE